MKTFRLCSLALLTFSIPAWASTPASGELTDTSGPITYTGGPYVVPNPSGISADVPPICEPALTICDKFALKVTISDKFRNDKKNEKEVVQMILNGTGPAAGSADLDLHLLDSTGKEVASSTSSTASEAISVPLKVLKNGDYTVEILAGIGLGSSSTTDIHIGRTKKAGNLAIAPMVVAPGETVSFDASSVSSATGYTFDFGDNSPAYRSSNGLAEHAYTSDGNYLAKVSYSDTGKALSGASQTVVVTSVPAEVSTVADKSGSNFSGAFGLPALLSLLGLALVRRRV